MSLIKCSECGSIISSKAAICPRCGYANNGGYNYNRTYYPPQPPQQPYQNGYTQQQYPYYPQNNPPAKPLRTNRGLAKFIIFSILTFGIYRLVVLSHISEEINYIATKHDGRNTMHYCLIFFLFSWLTLGIAELIWYSNISDRIGTELRRRNIAYSFSAGTFWGWGFFGVLLFGIGPLVYIHKFMHAMNHLAADYNRVG